MQCASLSIRARAVVVGAAVALVACTGSSPPIEAAPEPCLPDCVAQPCTDGYPEPLPPKEPDVGDEIGFRSGCDVLERDSEERPVLYRCDDDETLSVAYDADGRVTSALDVADLPGGLSETSWQFAYDDTGRVHEVASEGRQNGALRYESTLSAAFAGDVQVLEDRRVRVRPAEEARFVVDGFEAYHLVRS